MKDALPFQNTLLEAIDRRREWLDRTEVPRLKEEFRVYQSAFGGLYQVLLKKGIIHEDPYKNEEKIGDLQIPSEKPFLENERIDQMSMRLSHFEGQLDFLVNFFQFSADHFTLERIKRVLGLTKYFAWTNLSTNSPYINTRSLVEIINLVKGGNDQLSIGLIADALQHLGKSSKEVFRILKELTDFQRENYKVELRIRFLDAQSLDPAVVFTKKDETLLQLKRKFAESVSDRPFYPELVEEILREDYSGEGENLKRDLLKRLEVANDAPSAKKEPVSFKTLLIDGLRGLGSLSFSLEDTLRKLDENSALIMSRKNSVWDKVRRLIQQMLNKESDSVQYGVEYLDPVKGTTKAETLNYTNFRLEVERKSRFLATLAGKGSTAFKKLEAATDDQALDILAKNIEELQSLHKVMAALDVFFKSEVSRDDRERIRGIKPELSAIKNGIVKANQKRHEFIAQKEEQEQMKRLGIKDEA